jgi:hypothetical protein
MPAFDDGGDFMAPAPPPDAEAEQELAAFRPGGEHFDAWQRGDLAAVEHMNNLYKR